MKNNMIQTSLMSITNTIVVHSKSMPLERRRKGFLRRNRTTILLALTVLK